MCTGVWKGPPAVFLGRVIALWPWWEGCRSSEGPAGALAVEELPDRATGSPEARVAVAAASWKRCVIDLTDEA